MQLFINFLLIAVISFFVMFWVSFMNVTQAKVKKENPVYYGRYEIYGGNKTEGLGVVEVDVNLRYENCLQGIYQICLTLEKVCGNDFIGVWGWALQAVRPPYDRLDEGVDYVVLNGVITGGAVVNFSVFNDVNFSSFLAGYNGNLNNCNEGRKWGVYAFMKYLKPLGCDEYLLDLNGGVIGSEFICGYIDLLRK